jgi:hypothetical protein
MVDLTGWAAQQPWAARLFPSTSHEWLCVKLKPGFDTDEPFFSCVARADGQLYFKLWKSNGNQLEKQKFPVSEAQSKFWNFVQRLEGIA